VVRYGLDSSILHYSILLYCVDLTLRSTFAVFVQLWLISTRHLLVVVYHYMFRPNWPSSGVHVVVMTGSAALQ
jgi:hypothetical protein